MLSFFFRNQKHPFKKFNSWQESFIKLIILNVISKKNKGSGYNKLKKFKSVLVRYLMDRTKDLGK